MTEELKLGKLPATDDPRTIRLSSILKAELLPPLPAAYDVDESVGGIDNNRSFGNDKYGCCVISERAHHTLRFEKFEQDRQIEITDQEVIDQYFKETGGGDWGLNLLKSLNSWRNEGWPVGGRNYRIYAFASVDPKDHDEVRHCIHLLYGVNFGMRIYQRDMDQFNARQAWHLTSNDGEYKGGHGVYLHFYEADQEGITCTTWGRRQKMSWDFWDTRVDEAYGIVDQRNPWQGVSSPLDVQKLDAYLKEITAGNPQQNPGCAFWPVAIVKNSTRGKLYINALRR